MFICYLYVCDIIEIRYQQYMDFDFDSCRVLSPFSYMANNLHFLGLRGGFCDVRVFRTWPRILAF